MTPGSGIAALGLATPAPGGAAEQTAALFEGRPLFQRHPRWIGGDGQRQVMGFVPELRDIGDYPTRLALLAHRAFDACRRDQMARLGRVVPAPMLLLLPPALRDAGLQAAFRNAAMVLDFAGVTGVQLAFGEAPAGLALLHRLPPSPHYIAAADTLAVPFAMDMRLVQGLARDRAHPWNPVPAEAGTCLLVGAAAPPRALVQAVAVAQEAESLADPRRGLLGRGLGAAIDAVLATAPAPAMVMSDATGERWRAEEMGVVRSGRAALNAEGLDWHFPAQAMGDAGAAAGLVALALACGRPGTSLILASGRDGGRAAVMLAPSGGAPDMPPAVPPPA